MKIWKDLCRGELERGRSEEGKGRTRPRTAKSSDHACSSLNATFCLTVFMSSSTNATSITTLFTASWANCFAAVDLTEVEEPVSSRRSSRSNLFATRMSVGSREEIDAAGLP